jgi:TetR/AcrR family transcriptional regulator, regulator of autoinduction and epiphytic fitness
MSPCRPKSKQRRPYRSEQRSAQAQRTRQRIIVAAGERFVRDGYPATTMSAIAADAGVSVASVELAFGTKAAVLKAAIDIAIAGDHTPVAVLDRPWAADAQHPAGVEDFLTAVAHTLRPAMMRSAGLVLAAFDAAATDPAVRDLAAQLNEQRATTVAWIVDEIRRRGRLRPDITRRDAIDQLWLLMDPAVYQRLTGFRNWTPHKYQRWFVTAVTRLLLA